MKSILVVAAMSSFNTVLLMMWLELSLFSNVVSNRGLFFTLAHSTALAVPARSALNANG